MRKQEVLDTVWKEAAVSDSALARSVGLLPKTLADDSREPRFIETVPTIGYRFIADVDPAAAPIATIPIPAATSSLIANSQTSRHARAFVSVAAIRAVAATI